MKRYTLTTEAQEDIESIVDYIATEATAERARRVLRELRAAFRKLAGAPGVGHYREELLDRQYRFWMVYS